MLTNWPLKAMMGCSSPSIIRLITAVNKKTRIVCLAQHRTTYNFVDCMISQRVGLVICPTISFDMTITGKEKLKSPNLK